MQKSEEPYERVGITVSNSIMAKVKKMATKNDWTISHTVKNILIKYFEENK